MKQLIIILLALAHCSLLFSQDSQPSDDQWVSSKSSANIIVSSNYI